MKKTIFTLALCLAVAAVTAVTAQNPLNRSAKSILGKYLVAEPGNDSKVEITLNDDGSFDCTVIWLEHPNDPKTGQPLTDTKNSDKKLRDRPIVGLKLIQGLKYNADKQQWDGAKVYDPNRGIRANVTIWFTDDGQLALKGSVLGISETQYWKKL